jgi:penicillin amidase
MARRLKQIAVTLAGITVFAAGGALLLAAASLPRHEGRLALAGLGADVAVQFDARAIPRIRAESIEDAFRAQGFVHAQERFFQMDLIRRSAAGQLAGLVGARALPLDRARAPFEFRRRAATLLEDLPARHHRWLDAYTEGVNAGLAGLGARPPEYWLLGRTPSAWLPEDSLLVVFAIYTMLSNNEYYEHSQAVLAAALPDTLFDFLTPSASRYDRPLLASAGDPTGGYRPAALPDAATLDLRLPGRTPPPPGIVDPPMMGQAASNQWAVAAGRTTTGNALLANDPHLGFQLPNLFYRSELYWPGNVARGVSVPGLPGILLGANAAVAWGATVSYADQSDWVVIETDPADATQYLTADGPERFEIIRVTAGDGDVTETIEVRQTRFGPVVATDGLGRPLVLKATWLEPDGLSLDLLDIAAAASVDEALAIIGRWSGPALSFSLAGSDGEVAWILNGPLPRRIGFDGATPVSWRDGKRGWDGRREPPRLAPGDADIVFNANNRALPLPQALDISRVYMRPHRAARIAALLATADEIDEQALFRMQLDTSAEAYEPIRQLVLEVVPADATDPTLAAARAQAASWNGRADAEGPEFLTLQRLFRALLGRVLAPLLTPAVAIDPDFVYRWPLAEEVMLRLIEERPAHLLPRPFRDWDEFLRDVITTTLNSASTPIDTPWGVSNRLAVGHPLAGLPLLGRWLRAPAAIQPGSPVSLRVATPSRGAVFRMVVAPGAPERGILQLFGGQSGHPMSPHFLDQQPDWTGDVPTPFLAGPTVSTLALTPR